MTRPSANHERPFQTTARVVHNPPIARDTLRLRLRAPEMARRILPAQFIMIRPSFGVDPLLARPFALYDTADDADDEPATIDVVYLVVGNGTQALARLHAGDQVDVWGPLGNTFPESPPGSLLLVAGGVGQTPFLAVARERLGLRRYGATSRSATVRADSIEMFYGVRSADLLAGVADFTRAGVHVSVATNDGAAGHRGYVTDLVTRRLEDASAPPPAAIFGCGPEPMLARLADIARIADVPCWVSLESRMACGYGVCFSCVCPLHQSDGWDYRRTCVEGPIFPAEAVAWDQV